MGPSPVAKEQTGPNADRSEERWDPGFLELRVMITSDVSRGNDKQTQAKGQVRTGHHPFLLSILDERCPAGSSGLRFLTR